MPGPRWVSLHKEWKFGIGYSYDAHRMRRIRIYLFTGYFDILFTL